MKAHNIIHVSPLYPPHLGGLEKVVQTLAQEQTKVGLNVSVITSNFGNNKSNLMDTFKVTRLKSFVVANTTIMQKLLFNLLKIDRNDIVHLHVTQAYTPEMVWIASKIKGFQYIAHIHLDVPPSGKAGFLLKIYKPLVLKRVLRTASFVIVFTKNQKKELHKRYGINESKIKVVPNGAESFFFYKKARKLPNKPKLLFVGRLSFQKNLQQLLEALNGISEEFSTNIVGEGELGKELKKTAKTLKLKNVEFNGRADGKKLLDYYKRADIFVLPSEREGMPLVLLEAMAMGLPIVATDVVGNKDVVKNNKNGLLVPYDDHLAFQKALLRVKSDTRLYESMSKNSRKLSDQYSWSKISKTFQHIYEEVSN
ncbi:MAG TPA: glycosyltransferase family 4 protein [Candidatus Saccharimonadia bacterium]|nr:glycosyltransferase family 4 protein [Candidatus Saccharimonadia bacterium]